MLNNVLTVEEGKADSHKGRGWEQFTDAVVRAINRRGKDVRKNNIVSFALSPKIFAFKGKGVVVMLWGKPAQTKGASIDRKSNLVICSSHPSPLGATKTSSPFIGSKCFTLANDYLASKGMPKIDWNL